MAILLYICVGQDPVGLAGVRGEDYPGVQDRGAGLQVVCHTGDGGAAAAEPPRRVEAGLGLPLLGFRLHGAGVRGAGRPAHATHQARQAGAQVLQVKLIHRYFFFLFCFFLGLYAV